MLAYFFCLSVYYGDIHKPKKNKAPFEKLRLADFSIMNMVLLEFSFCSCLGEFGGVADHPRQLLKKLDWIK